MSYVLKRKIPPLLKYPGGKNKELNNIIEKLPRIINNYYEPFVGGGAVYFALDCSKYFINDKSTELMNVYHSVANRNQDLLYILEQFDHNWIVMSNVIDNHSQELIDIYFSHKIGAVSSPSLRKIIHGFVSLNADEFNGMLQPTFNVRIDNFVEELEKCIVNKMVRMKKIEIKKGDLSHADLLRNIEVSFKGAFYMHFRFLYNIKNELLQNNEITMGYATALFVFIRQYCYSSMFRFNRNGDFNVPYGGISYNRKSLRNNISNYRSESMAEHMSKTVLGNMDFYEFMREYVPQENDFVFLDPPYDTEFSTYDKNEFTQNDQVRLADYLINECNANFMLVIKNTEFISSLYPVGQVTVNGGAICISSFKKKYFVSFQDRNDKDAEHLVITNYAV